MNYLRLIIVSLVSPLTAPLAVFIIQMFRNHSEFSLSDLTLTLIIYGCLSYFTTAMFGLPIFYIFRLLKSNKIINFLASGAIAGLIGAYFINKIFPLPMRTQVYADLYDYLMYCAAGVLTGLTFWLVLYGFKFNQSSATKLK